MVILSSSLFSSVSLDRKIRQSERCCFYWESNSSRPANSDEVPVPINVSPCPNAVLWNHGIAYYLAVREAEIPMLSRYSEPLQVLFKQTTSRSVNSSRLEPSLSWTLKNQKHRTWHPAPYWYSVTSGFDESLPQDLAIHQTLTDSYTREASVHE